MESNGFAFATGLGAIIFCLCKLLREEYYTKESLQLSEVQLTFSVPVAQLLNRTQVKLSWQVIFLYMILYVFVRSYNPPSLFLLPVTEGCNCLVSIFHLLNMYQL